jgi:hypothetical protein
VALSVAAGESSCTETALALALPLALRSAEGVSEAVGMAAAVL